MSRKAHGEHLLMNTRDISQAKDPDLRGSLAALRRAAVLAREEAIRTGTELVVVENGTLTRIDAERLRTETPPAPRPTP